MVRNRHVKLNYYILISFILIAFLSIIFLMIYHALYGAADMPFQIKRVNELVFMIKSHHLLPNFAFNQFHGSAVMYMYPYLSMVPLAFLSFVIPSKIVLIYLYFVFNIFICLCICFYSSLTFSKSIRVSYLFSLIYSLSNMFLVFCFVSMDFGVEVSYTFFPLIFFGSLELIYNDKIAELTCGLSLIVFSHVLTTAVSIIFIFILCIFNIQKINFYIIINFAKAILMVILITSIEWIPTFQFISSNYSNVHITKTPYFFGFTVSNFLKDSTFHLDNYGIGLIPLLCIILSVIFYKKYNNQEKKMVWISFMIIIMSEKVFPWKILPEFLYNILRCFQFSYRFLIIPILLLSYLFSIIILRFIKLKYIFIIITVSVLFLQILGQFDLIHKINSQPNISYINLNRHFNGANYKITKTSQFSKLQFWNFIENEDYYPSKFFTYENHLNNKLRIHKNYNSNNIYLNSDKNEKNISLPSVGYNKEPIKIIVDNKYKKFYVNKYGLISLNNLTKGMHQIKIVQSTNLFIHLCSYIFSIVGIVSLLYRLMKEKKCQYVHS